MAAARAAVVVVRAGVLVMCAGSVAEAHQLCVYIDKSGLTGHVFVQMLPTNGPQAGRTDLCYGKYPAGADIFGGAGVIKWDKGRKWSQKICFTVTAAQYNAAGAKINTKLAAPTPYNLLTANCVDWANAVATAAGQVPPASSWWGISDPETMGQTVKAAGNGAVLNGGTITYNAAPNIGPDGNPVAFNPPRDFDAGNMAALCHSDPAQVAGKMGVMLNQQGQGPVETGIGQEYAVMVFGANPDSSLISISWGDGSPIEAQDSVFSHSYALPGVYTASVITINSGMVNHVSWRVMVNDGGRPATTPVNVPPPPPPRDFPNPGFEGAPNPDELRACAADVNGDTIVDFFDYLDFVALFAAEDPRADFNGDDAVDFFDYLDFAAAFDLGCE
jgi:hypothetical protein